jgi:cytoskeletal protein CcmA (bactofilin family)
MEQINMGIFSTEKKIFSQGAVDTFVGEKAKIKGEIVSSGSVSINGYFEGKISADGEVIVATEGKIVGSIIGGVVVVSGKVDGNIIGSERIEIIKTGKVHGDLSGGKIIIEDGALYSGRVKVEGIEAGVEKSVEKNKVFETKEPSSALDL